jgi:hypothetical protein
MWKAAFVVAGAVVGYVGPIAVGAVLHYVMELASSWPGRTGPAAGYSGLANWIRVIGIPLGVLVFSLLGLRLGSRLDKRAGRDEARLQWRAVFCVLGALLGHVIGCFGSYFMLGAVGLKGDAVLWTTILLGIPAGGAVFAPLGIRLGYALDGQSQQSNAPREWKAPFASLGAAVGPVVGFYVVFFFAAKTVGQGEFGGLVAAAYGLLQGVPVGGIVVCLLGFCLGAALDERSRSNDTLDSESLQ